MKVITIKQPWASLIAEGYKEYEFRTWKTKYRGDILIHAGKGIDSKAMKTYENYNLSYPRGCIIAVAKITDCLDVNDELKNNLKNNEVYSNIIKSNKSYYAFKLENVNKIKPIPINGKLSLWDYEYKND